MATLSDLLGSTFSGLGFTFYSSFDTNAVYNTNDVVRYTDGNTYVAIANGISTGTAPNLDTSNWALFVPKGETGAAGSGGATTGSIIKTYQVVKTDTFTTASTSWVDVTGLSLTVTPSSQTSKFLLVSDVSVGPNSGAGSLSQRFTKNSTVLPYVGDAADIRPQAMAVGYPGDSAGTAPAMVVTKVYLDSPATTSSITYSIQVLGSTTVPGYINRTVADRNTSGYDARTASSFTIFEIAG